MSEAIDRDTVAAGPLIRNVSDTATWAAWYRALESARPDALFRDPLAERLAGARGAGIASSNRHRDAWAWSMRTVLFDELLRAELALGTDLVLDLAAGLDARPYRMDLPASLRWVEVDLPGILDDKESILAGETPRCRLERVRMDLADRAARQELFGRLGAEARRIVVLSEGLLVYLDRDGVAALAEDLAAVPSMRRWVVDILSPGLVQMLRKQMGAQLDAAQAPLLFGPEEGPQFFAPHGWQPLQVRSVFQAARQFHRLPLLLRLFAFLPEPQGRQGKRPWSAAVLLGR